MSRRRALPLWLAYALLFAAALGLRLAVWRWREPYPLSGDESEYWQQALTLLQQKQYVELRLMRPPLYTLFLAGCIYLFDSLIQNVRLVQAVVSTLTIFPVAALAHELARSRRAALLAALLFAASYTLAATATELLTETVFLFGLSAVLWLLLRSARLLREGGQRGPLVCAALAGLGVGLLALVRSVALPLLPLGAVWLLAQPGAPFASPRWRWLARRAALPLAFAAAALLLIAPWAARNTLAYHALILIDTTGAENLWLDNNFSAASADDPLGRDAAKAQLYAMEEDRAGRQQLATRRGVAEIAAHPAMFAQKLWGEAKKFFALQHFDELREKRAIWVPPAEVWAKLLLGDGVWLALLLGGLAGMCFWPGWGQARRPRGLLPWLGAALADQRTLLAPWAAYILLTSLLFHVELRYRLPIYPALAPFAGWAAAALHGRWARPTRGRVALAAALAASALALMLLHRPYLAEAWMLADKHIALWEADRALERGDSRAASRSAAYALAMDDTSALARVAQARAALLAGDRVAAERAMDAAIAALGAHPQAHLLRGALLRHQGDAQQARAELAYETASLQDLQAWSWDAFAPLGGPPAALDVGGGLDLGYLRGFYPAQGGYRWSTAQAQVRLARPGAARVQIDLAPGRPSAAPPPTIFVYNGGTEIGQITLRDGWQQVVFSLESTTDVHTITLRTTTFRPRDLDPASGDSRQLGVMVRRIELVP
ncbi:glycosyl transferase [Chloroflexia bacterium SDU3-3]|nr:glycosyl transferase [Chloroflexia bacterium SDU3-3]